MDDVMNIHCSMCEGNLPEGALFCGECGSSSLVGPDIRQKMADARPNDTAVIDADALRSADILTTDSPHNSTVMSSSSSSEELGESMLSVHSTISESHDVEVMRAAEVVESTETRAVLPPVFELVFSTGERVTVFGSGLIGRRPQPHDGERFDHLVKIMDLARSVSKTHLEFGYEKEILWIVDRFSSNGSVFQRPHELPVHMEPGRRYSVPRGTRVDLANQFMNIN